MSKKKTHEEYVTKVAMINPNIEVVGVYVNAHVHIKHKCKIDGYEWEVEPNSILRGSGCPRCSGKERKNTEKYKQDVLNINKNIEVMGDYINIQTKILHRCKIDGYEWYVQPSNILNGSGCPVCVGQKIGFAPEYKNSIWASDYRDLFSKYMTEEQMKSYMPNSERKLDIVCPDCGRVKLISPYAIKSYGLGCICKDGNSYPNKFVSYFLEQVGIKYQNEYSPDWANKKRYDIYIPELNCIIENHGTQHYVGWNANQENLKQQIENDEYKKILAFDNGISKYIVVDCRKSTLDWIKQSIMNSELNGMLGFSAQDIDWNKCHEFALSNIVKKTAELYCSGFTVREISNILNIGRCTAVRYLNKATKLGWCLYDGKTEMCRRFKTKQCL